MLATQKTEPFLYTRITSLLLITCVSLAVAATAYYWVPWHRDLVVNAEEEIRNENYLRAKDAPIVETISSELHKAYTATTIEEALNSLMGVPPFLKILKTYDEKQIRSTHSLIDDAEDKLITHLENDDTDIEQWLPELQETILDIPLYKPATSTTPEY